MTNRPSGKKRSLPSLRMTSLKRVGDTGIVFTMSGMPAPPQLTSS